MKAKNKMKLPEQIGKGINKDHTDKVLKARKDTSDLRTLQPFTASRNEWNLLKEKAHKAGYVSISKYAREILGIDLKK